MRAWQKMLSGRKLDLINPSAMDIEIEDIAHGLSRVSRWNGQTAGEHAFSVAQHSIMVEEIARNLQPTADKSWLLTALLNDAAEYVIGNMISPFKDAMGIDYKSFEAKLMQAVHVRFGLPAIVSPQMRKFILRADKVAAYLEATQIAGFTDVEARKFFGPAPVTVSGWKVVSMSANDAKKLYIDRFEALHHDMQEAAAA